MDAGRDMSTAIEALPAHGSLAWRAPEVRAALAAIARLRDYAAGEARRRASVSRSGSCGC
jgi:hypothetical protein